MATDDAWPPEEPKIEIILNKLLCFIVNKFHAMPVDDIALLCKRCFSDEDIMEGKKILPTICEKEKVNLDPYKKRSGAQRPGPWNWECLYILGARKGGYLLIRPEFHFPRSDKYYGLLTTHLGGKFKFFKNHCFWCIRLVFGGYI